jgi:hypothetical protein
VFGPFRGLRAGERSNTLAADSARAAYHAHPRTPTLTLEMP